MKRAEHSRRSNRVRGIVPFAALGALVGGCADAWPEPPGELRVDAIVVLGNRPPTDARGELMPETRRRVERGVELYRRGHAPLVVMAGGPAPRGEIESEVMRAAAIERSVPSQDIRVETRSRNTIENARYARALFEGDGRNAVPPRILLVTSPSHLGRARRLFECAGFVVHPAASAPPDRLLRRLRDAVYELAVEVYYAFVDECGDAKSPR